MCSKTCNNDRPLLIAITGGIGSGKSVVAEMLRSMGHCVYDCDSRARTLMDSNPEIAQQIAQSISPQAINPDGSISRARLGEIVFYNPDKLQQLNKITHQHVLADLDRWVDEHAGTPVVWVETAILYQSGLDKMVDRIWEVTAPEDVRINRVMDRNSLSRTHVQSRIDSQRHEVPANHPSVETIVNDDLSPLLPQIETLLQQTLD